MSEHQESRPDGGLLIYRADEDAAPIRVLLETAIYEENELQPEATLKKYLIVRAEGKRQVTRHHQELPEQPGNRCPQSHH